MKVLYPFLVAVLLGGCTVNRAFVNAVDASWSVIGPEYMAYIEADEDLDDLSKGIRVRTARLLTETIEEAKQ